MPGVTAPLRDEHQELLPRIDALAHLAASLLPSTPATAFPAADVIATLRDDLVPHAEAEEAVLYPAYETAAGAPGGTATMVADHREIRRRLDALDDLVARLRATPDDAPAMEELRGALYGLHAILRLHFDKEEQVLLPVLDEHLSADAAADLFARMGEVAHGG